MVEIDDDSDEEAEVGSEESNEGSNSESNGGPPSWSDSSGSDSSDSSDSSDDSSKDGDSEGPEDNDSDDDEPPPKRTKPRQRAAVVTPTTRKSKPSKWQEGLKPFFDAMVRMSNKNLKIALQANRTAVTATGSLASKLSVTRLEVLEACAGHDDDEGPFTPPPIYAELNAAGWAKDAVYTALRRSCVEVKNSRHRCNVHVTPKMVATFKSGNLSLGRDKTYEGCTAGVTVFAVPQLSQKMAQEDILEYQAFEGATHKTQADSRKHLTGQKFEPPKSVHEVIRVLNNYICWLEVMFGSECRHLLQVVRLRDSLDDNEEELELAMCKFLRLSILWKVHEDSRYFFDQCETWRRGEPLPRSRLAGTVDLLENDQQVIRSITCPFDDFFPKEGNPKDKGKGKDKTGGGGLSPSKDKDPKNTKKEPQPTSNPTIPALCVAAVKKYHAAHPDMPITKFAIEAGIPTYRFVVGDKGNCTNFSLLGKCTAICNYKHEVCVVPDGKQKEVAALLLEGMKTIADKKTATPP